ncbi:tripartite tricarboxylate transporter TctB family protein [Colwellia sp. TT2012]|uniref:tripartite tricarboxylate transporter TctB family protein n=1 Tax=Colwellia sp. TT2012 TaxID=1720342 RepID=UPI00070ACB7F|nr:tripartite tricarboxylate transporter TctB family protein [Colwellia sp. TT2012]
MKISKNVIGALIFFIFSVSYGYHAYQIPLYPGEEYDVFTSQTMPKLYAFLGIIVSILAIIMSVLNDSRTTNDTEKSADDFDKKSWLQVASLIALMVYYGATLEQFGFILSTISFLIFGFLILGERSKKRLFLASVPVVIVFWAIMTQLLGIYLSPGDLWG